MKKISKISPNMLGKIKDVQEAFKAELKEAGIDENGLILSIAITADDDNYISVTCLTDDKEYIVDYTSID